MGVVLVDSPSITVSVLKVFDTEPATGFLAMRVVSGSLFGKGVATSASWDDWYNKVDVGLIVAETGGKLARLLEMWAQLRYVDKCSVSLS